MVAHKSFLYHHNRFSVSRQWTIAQTFKKFFLGSKILFVSLAQFFGKLYVILPKIQKFYVEDSSWSFRRLPVYRYVPGGNSMPEVFCFLKKASAP